MRKVRLQENTYAPSDVAADVSTAALAPLGGADHQVNPMYIYMYLIFIYHCRQNEKS